MLNNAQDKINKFKMQKNILCLHGSFHQDRLGTIRPELLQLLAEHLLGKGPDVALG